MNDRVIRLLRIQTVYIAVAGCSGKIVTSMYSYAKLTILSLWLYAFFSVMQYVELAFFAIFAFGWS